MECATQLVTTQFERASATGWTWVQSLDSNHSDPELFSNGNLGTHFRTASSSSDSKYAALILHRPPDDNYRLACQDKPVAARATVRSE